MKEDIGVVYSELYEILKNINKEKVMKISPKIIDKIINERDKNYEPKINWNKPLTEQDINQNTKNILAWINLKYWASDEEKDLLLEKIERNKEKYEGSYENLFYNKKLPQKSSKTNIFQKIINFFRGKNKR
jgi:hypothetical protein